jgi:hypothetical protein
MMAHSGITAVGDHEMLAHLRRIARQQGWRVVGWRYRAMREVLGNMPRINYGMVICLLEKSAATGLLAHETEPRPAAEVIELHALTREAAR